MTGSAPTNSQSKYCLNNREKTPTQPAIQNCVIDRLKGSTVWMFCIYVFKHKIGLAAVNKIRYVNNYKQIKVFKNKILCKYVKKIMYG